MQSIGSDSIIGLSHIKMTVLIVFIVGIQEYIRSGLFQFKLIN